VHKSHRCVIQGKWGLSVAKVVDSQFY